ncbi:glycosyltransferase family 2 protein [Candidatus Daviesbacteria bacterium]|nr:glycosyltransferase family 2 protein [Candidatus Daviesbacteria bacterium]
MKRVGVIILNYKVKDLTISSLESVAKSTYKDILIFVVDNASGDGLGKELESRKDVNFIQNTENLGYAGGNNVGIKKAIEEGVDYVFILNPDATVDKRAIEILVNKANALNADLLNPKIYFSNSNKIWFAGKKFDKANVLGLHIGMDEEDHGQYSKDVESEDITGAALFVKAEVFKKIGYFDDRYFLYYEESDFGFRAKEAGFKIMYIPEAIVYHRNAQSTGLGSSLQDYYITRNRMLFASKFLSLRTQFALIREAIRNFNKPVRRQAFVDFLLKKFGKGSFAI